MDISIMDIDEFKNKSVVVIIYIVSLFYNAWIFENNLNWYFFSITLWSFIIFVYLNRISNINNIILLFIILFSLSFLSLILRILLFVEF